MSESDQTTNTATRRSRLRDPSTYVVLGVVFVVAVAWVLLGRDVAVLDDADAQTPIRASVMRVQPEAVPLAPRYLAQCEASQRIEIRSRVRGFLNERHFREGGTVQRDEPMFTIDPQPFQASLEVARARVVSAEARYDQAERQVERYRGLYDQGAATASELEEWETSLQVATSDIELYKAQLTQAELDLSYTKVASPIRGVVGRAMRDVGSFVDDGSNSLLAVVEAIDPIYVRFSMSEQDLLRYRGMRPSGRLSDMEGDRVQVQITLRDGSILDEVGEISFVDVRIDDTTSTVVLRATVPNEQSTLRPGQFVHVTLLGFERESMVVVPQQAVVQTPTSASVYVLSRQGNFARVRFVELGEWYRNGWVIESGLDEGDLVIVDNVMRVRPGSPIEVDEELTIDDFDVEPSPDSSQPPSFQLDE